MFLNGIKKLSDEGLQAAVLMKHAGRETRRLQALAMAWQLKEAEYYGRLMKEVRVATHTHYEEHCEATLEENVIKLDVDESANETEDNVDGTIALDHELYNEYIVSLNTMGTQLDQLEEVVMDRLSTSPRNSPQEVGSSTSGSVGLKDDIDGDI